ncbi:HAD family hydrolase [Streptomyces sp. NPDC002888]|uniref:HAD family hydrolase n=1 Tax=Streptomyces sp. NPDC002888 TaxID=3364668 RepID=UPI00369A7E85
MQRLALFDLDGTLVDRQAAFTAWAKEFAEERELGEGAVGWLCAADGRGRVSRERFFHDVRERFGLDQPALELWGRFRERMPEFVRCDSGVLDGLAWLRASGWLVGIVSNGMADIQLRKLERTGLRDAVDGYCISGAVHIRKPDVRIFQLAAHRCGAGSVAGGWMVGDHPEHDILGGHAAGLRTIWVRQDGIWPSDVSAPHADRVVSDITAAIGTLLHDS